MTPLLQHLDREEAHTYSLVLSAAGIGNRVVPFMDGFRIEVPAPLVEGAWEAIRQYEAENPPFPADQPAASPADKPLPFSGIVVALMLLVVHLAVTSSAAPDDYSRVFGADARRILAGELYRCATALVLHADATHIAGNMAGIALFGGAVGAITGTGVGWLLILICGALGNLLNAWAHQTNHLSIGASTAVFGAVGILCAIQAIHAVQTGQGWKRVALITGAGVALLAFLGTSPYSDIGAHLFGWAAGIAAGGVSGLWMKAVPGKRIQMGCGALAAALLTLAWVRGVVA